MYHPSGELTGTYYCLVAAEVRERLSVSKRETEL